LFLNTKDPASCKCFQEADKQHDKVDVPIHNVQKAESSVGAVDDTEQETNNAHDTGELCLAKVG